jgi:hypothetical protein
MIGAVRSHELAKPKTQGMYKHVIVQPGRPAGAQLEHTQVRSCIALPARIFDRMITSKCSAHASDALRASGCCHQECTMQFMPG